jgi:Xaa-Pro aminopeptidase
MTTAAAKSLHTDNANSKENLSQDSVKPTPSYHHDRILRLLDLLREATLDFLLIQGANNVRYFTGFTGSNRALLIDLQNPPHSFLCTDKRYHEQALHELAAAGQESVEIVLGSAIELLKAKTRGRNIRVGMDLANVNALTFRELANADGYIEDVSSTVADLRAIKDELETKLIKRAAQVADRAFQLTLARMSGSTEVASAAFFEYTCRLTGGDGEAFATIVASGSHSALPHAQPRRVVINEGPVVMDFGAEFGGYKSDCTRSFWIGNPPADYLATVRLVDEAKQAAEEAMRPGALVADLERMARTVLKNAGREEYLLHGIGHGVGLDIHEFPFTATKEETVLAPGMVVTIEPGLYYREHYGVRIEDLYLITTAGFERLTNPTGYQ